MICFRTDAGVPGAGFGHLMRCLAIADALRDKGATAYFAMKSESRAEQIAKECGYKTLSIPAAASPQEDLRASLLLMEDADIVVADSYRFDSDYLSGLRQGGKFVVALDDLADRKLPVDVVIGNAYATPELYAKNISEGAAILVGPEYLPLRKQFQGCPLRDVRDHLARVLVTMGGEDACNATRLVVESLAEYPSPLTLDILLGPAYAHHASLEAVLNNDPHKYRVYEQVAQVSPLYLQADAAITAGGSTVWELAAVGVPMVILQTAENQRGIIKYAVENELGVVLGKQDQIMLSDVTQGLRGLEDRQVRERYAARCRTLVDGKGGERIAEALLALSKKRFT
jgi:UDP-2,4-diacetamido-2,4,6-trideoxy-beta-L-altropyranose hydrolase